MKKLALLPFAALIALVLNFAAPHSAAAQDAASLVQGQWSLEGTLEKSDGKYSYGRNVRWSLSDGVFYQDGNDYSNTQVSGNTITAGYDKSGEKVSIRIEFTSDDTAEYFREGYNDSYGNYTVRAKATRKK